MSEFKGFKQVTKQEYESTTSENRKDYIWFVRELSGETVLSSSIYLGNREYTKGSIGDYYSKSEIDSGDVVMVEKIVELQKSKQDKLTAGTNIIIDSANTISATSSYDDSELRAAISAETLNRQNADSIIESGLTGLSGSVINNYYTKDKIDEDSLTISKAINDLNTGKQKNLIAGDNITIVTGTTADTINSTYNYDDSELRAAISANTTAIESEATVRFTKDTDLQDQIYNLRARGRFLSLWNSVTGLAETNPTTSPYEYKTGDYFIVGTIAESGGVNYKPSGLTYVIDQASTVVDGNEVNINDVYYFDGSTWRLENDTQKNISFINIAGSPYDNSNLAIALSAKTSVDDSITSTEETWSSNKINDSLNTLQNNIDEKQDNLTFTPPLIINNDIVSLTIGDGLSKSNGDALFVNVGSGITINSTTKKVEANLVTQFQNSPDNTHIPTEKLVKDSLDKKQDINYFYFEAIESNCSVGWHYENYTGSPEVSLQYSYDKITWNDVISDTDISVNINNKVYFKGNNLDGLNNSSFWEDEQSNHFYSTKKVNVGGNIMSLMYSDLSSNVLTRCTFIDLFGGYSNSENTTQIVDCSYLKLPATTLEYSCYGYMFYDSTNLVTTPELPATDLVSSCYYGMFYGCTSLVNAPVLPATTLATSCYGSMFYGCTNLINAPVLPATDLVSSCYYDMFYGCSKLNYIKCLATSGITTASNCTNNWVSGVNGSGSFVVPNSMRTIWDSKTSGSGKPTNFVYGICEGDETKMINGETIIGHGDILITNNYLTFTALQDSTLGITNNDNNKPNIEYSKNGGEWIDWKKVNYSSISLTKGDKVRMRGNNLSGFNSSYSAYSKFTMTEKIAGSGNIMSLIDGIGETNVIPNSNCFYGLFKDCKKLVTAPELPATTLTSSCYIGMFYGCTSLVTAPVLHATTLQSGCYNSMFYGCSSLINAPVLPATTLATGCYNFMFYNCSKLNYIKCLATSISQNDTSYWVYGVNSNSTFVVPNSMRSTWNNIAGKPTNFVYGICEGDEIYKGGNGIQIDSSNTISASNNFLPIGSITMWAGAYTEIPDGWVLCDGSAIDVTEATIDDYDIEFHDEYYKASNDEYRKLVKIIGAKYGYSGNLNSIKIPNLEQRFPLGAVDGGRIPTQKDSTGGTLSYTTISLGDTGGESTHKLTAKESGLPLHSHELRGSYKSTQPQDLGQRGYPALDRENNGRYSWTENHEAWDAEYYHNNIPPYLALNFIIKYK